MALNHRFLLMVNLSYLQDMMEVTAMGLLLKMVIGRRFSHQILLNYSIPKRLSDIHSQIFLRPTRIQMLNGISKVATSSSQFFHRIPNKWACISMIWENYMQNK